MIAGGRASAPAASVSRRSGILSAIAALAVVLGTFAFRYVSYSGFSNDHFVHLARAQQVLLGAWPIRDFVDPGMPLMYLTSVVGLLAAGHNLIGEALISFGAIAIAGALAFKAAEAASGSTFAGATAALVQAISYPRSYSYPKLLLYALAILMCWRCISRPSMRSCAGLGVLVAIAFLFRHDHGLFIGAAALLSMFLARGSWSHRAAGAAALAAGALVLLLPWAVFVQSTLGFPAYIKSAVEFSQIEASQTRMAWPRFQIDPAAGLWTTGEAVPEERALIHVRWAPGISAVEQARRERSLGLEVVQQHEGRTWRYTVDRSPARARALRDDPAVEDTAGLERLQIGWGERVAGWFSPLRGEFGPGVPVGRNAEALLYYTMLALPALAAAAALRWRRGAAPMPDGGARLAVVAILGLCTAATFLRDPLRERLADAIVPAVVLGAWLLASAWRGARPLALGLRWSARLGVLTLACVLAGAVTVVGSTSEQIDRIGRLTADALRARASAVTRSLRDEYESSYLPGTTTFALRPAFEWLQSCTAPSDRFSFIGFAPEAYFFARRGFAAGHVAFVGSYYSSRDEQALMIDRLGRERVPLVLLPQSYAADFERLFGDVDAYLRANFARVGTLELAGEDQATVLINREMTPARMYAPLGWPCFRS
jgi:hypothetical protein